MHFYQYYSLLITILEILFLVSFGFAALRLFVAAYNFISKPVLSNFPIDNETDIRSSCGKVSILVPARNEAHNLPLLIKSIYSQPFQNFELIILNDDSSDDTEKVVLSYKEKYSSLKLIQGKELPSGWLGKNWACHQLFQESKEDYVLFIDADVVIKNDALPKALGIMSKYNLSLLSVFPEQEMRTWGEKVTVPIMHYLLLSLLPLDFIYLLKPKSLAAANGQFMLFAAEAYRKHLFHSICKNEIVEDIKIMQTIKSLELKGKTLLGNGLIYCRMYKSYKDGISGFSKNLLSGFGGSQIGLLVYLGLILIIPFSMLFFNSQLAGWYLLIALLIRVLVSLVSKQDVIQNLALHFAQMGSLLWIAFKTIGNSYFGTLEWKGRKIK